MLPAAARKVSVAAGKVSVAAGKVSSAAEGLLPVSAPDAGAPSRSRGRMRNTCPESMMVLISKSVRILSYIVILILKKNFDFSHSVDA